MTGSESCPILCQGNEAPIIPFILIVNGGTKMFTLDEILKLHDAGFSAEQITALAGIGIAGGNSAPQPKVIEKEDVPQPDMIPAAEQPVLQPAKPEQEISSLKEDFKAAVDEALKEIRNTAINNSRMPQQTETVDDVLASIINPK